MITIYGLKTCDTCRKALKALPGAGFRDVRAEPLGPDEIAEFLSAFGERLVNRASTTWRGLHEARRQAPPAVLLAEYPTLMKRPVIRANGALLLGWTPATRAALGAA
jgi:arsenate reductase (glutaredoxin)